VRERNENALKCVSHREVRVSGVLRGKTVNLQPLRYCGWDK
jgi:hypothetical protein